jgi:hypothetical protein
VTDNREHPIPGQQLMRVELSGGDGYGGIRRSALPTNDIDDANVVTSLVQRSRSVHRAVLDLDMPVQCWPSSTPGHFHLFIDHYMSWEHYRKLLNVLCEVGILEPGFAQESCRDEFTCVRLPWIKKDET